MRARPGLRGFPPLPRRVPMRRVRAEDPAVPRARMRLPTRGARIDRAEGRRPLPRPPRDHPGVALRCRRGIRRVDEGPPRTEGAVLVVPGRSQARARARRFFRPRRDSCGRDSCVASCVVVVANGSVVAVVIGVVLVRRMRATDGSMRDVRTIPRGGRRGREGELRLCQSRRRQMRAVPRCRVRLERARGRQRATDQDRTRVVRVVRRAVRAPGEGQGARQVPVPGVRRGHGAVREVPGIDANARAARRRFERRVERHSTRFVDALDERRDVPPMRGDTRDAERRRGARCGTLFARDEPPPTPPPSESATSSREKPGGRKRRTTRGRGGRSRSSPRFRRASAFASRRGWGSGCAASAGTSTRTPRRGACWRRRGRGYSPGPTRRAAAAAAAAAARSGVSAGESPPRGGPKMTTTHPPRERSARCSAASVATSRGRRVGPAGYPAADAPTGSRRSRRSSSPARRPAGAPRSTRERLRRYPSSRAGGRARRGSLRTPRALVVARYEECVLGMVAGAQRARLSPVQRLAIDSLKSHPMRVVLETRFKRSGADYRRIADAAVLAAFAASPWASVTEGNGVIWGDGRRNKRTAVVPLGLRRVHRGGRVRVFAGRTRADGTSRDERVGGRGLRKRDDSRRLRTAPDSRSGRRPRR